jgi:HAD superfamily phosphoserine phosphatase-like hydrolase
VPASFTLLDELELVPVPDVLLELDTLELVPLVLLLLEWPEELDEPLECPASGIVVVLLLEQCTIRSPAKKAAGEPQRIQFRVIGRASRRPGYSSTRLVAKKAPSGEDSRLPSSGVKALPLSALLDRLDHTRGECTSPVLAFDGDGTLWGGDVGDDFFHASLARGGFRSPAIDAMRNAGRAAGVALDAHHDDGVAVAKQLFQAYLDHTFPEELICEVITWLWAGWPEEEVKRFADEVAERANAASRIRPELRAVVEWARSHAVPAFLVSASPRPIVEAVGAALGFDRSHILAVTARYDERRVMLADVERPIPYGPGKASLLASRLSPSGGTLLAAFGDNVFDLPMLEAAMLAVVVDPKPRLVAALDAGTGVFREPPVRLALG